MKIKVPVKIQLGGAKNGLFRSAYQVGIADIVKGVPSNPTSSQPMTAILNLNTFFM
jgi:hypothetical protein